MNFLEHIEIIELTKYFFGIFGCSLTVYLISKIRKKLHKQAVRKKLKTFEDDIKKTNINILHVAQGSPYFLKQHIITDLKRDSNIFLAFPSEYSEQSKKITGNFVCNDIGLENINIINMNKEEFTSHLEESRNKIAKIFLNEQEGAYFNNKSFGVKKAHSHSCTPDHKERPLLKIDFFETDYFTSRILADLYNKIKSNYPEPNISTLNNELWWVRASFGLSIIVKIPDTNEIIMTTRSKNAAFSEGKNWIYVSATEAMSHTDYNLDTDIPDIYICIERALREELGLEKDTYSQDSIMIYDMFFEKYFHQDGLTVSVELKSGFDFADVKKCYQSARDRLLESDEIFLIDDNNKKINEFIHENYENMRSQTIFALKRYIYRNII